MMTAEQAERIDQLSTEKLGHLSGISELLVLAPPESG